MSSAHIARLLRRYRAADNPRRAIEVEVARIQERLAEIPGSDCGVYVDATDAPVYGNPHGRLAGVVTFIKDLSDVAGMPSSYGSERRRVIPSASDHVVAGLLAEGVTVVGKSTTSEMGMTAYTEPVGFPAPRNLLWPGATTGGSSGGAAALVAHGVVPCAHGSDGGGSIRVPAAACGLVGYKPPHTSGEGRLTAQGFVTTRVDDAALLSGTVPVHRPLRIGVLRIPLHGDGGVDTPMLAAVEEVAHVCQQRGHEVREVSPAYGQDVFQAFETLMAYKATKITGSASPIVEHLRERGRAFERGRVSAAVRLLDNVDEQVRSRWPIDVLLTPTLAFDPPPVGHFSRLAPSEDFAEQTRWTPWCTLFNITGRAAISVPWRLPGRPPVGVHMGCIHASPAELLGLAQELHP